MLMQDVAIGKSCIQKRREQRLSCIQKRGKQRIPMLQLARAAYRRGCGVHAAHWEDPKHADIIWYNPCTRLRPACNSRQRNTTTQQAEGHVSRQACIITGREACEQAEGHVSGQACIIIGREACERAGMYVNRQRGT